VKVYFHTFGCKANQYDTERMRQEVESRGARSVDHRDSADVLVVNTCTVTNQADAEARRFVRRLRRESPRTRVVVVGCSAALKADMYRRLDGVDSVIPGHDPHRIADAVAPTGGNGDGLVQLEARGGLDRMDHEPVGADLLRRRSGATRGWLKIQDGCDRKCSFCATRLARGPSRSRLPEEVIAEAALLAEGHPELVLTGIHIGHYGLDLDGADAGAGRGSWTLARLLGRLLEDVPGVRFRLGSVEATEIDDELLDCVAGGGTRVAAHLHMPLQSGADPVLRRMRRWHTRDQYRRRALEIAARLPVLGLGADVITGFPGETEEDHAATVELVEELPFTYLHVFPFSPRDDTAAAELVREDPVPQRVAGERSLELREIVRAKGMRYEDRRAGGEAHVTLERGGREGLTGDYLRVRVRGAPGASPDRLHRGVLQKDGEHLYIDLSRKSHDG
jgi:threonylcarbamoyladenosine tRNA methylthiotransferase MtaB